MNFLKRLLVRGRLCDGMVLGRIYLGGELLTIRIFGGLGRNFVIRQGDELRFTLKEMSRVCFDEYFAGWHRRQVRRLFSQSIDRWRIVMDRMGYFTPVPCIKVYRMHRAWGRCYYTRGVITLNLRLGSMPIECIDYITLHELCHFLVHSHSVDFYSIMGRIDPEWERKAHSLEYFARQGYF